MHRLRKLANVIDEYDQDYADKYGKVTPYHILFKDYGDDIASLDVEAAIQFCIDKIDELNTQYADDPDYRVVGEEEKDDLLLNFRNEDNDSGMDVLFIIKDHLLETEGLEVNSSRLRKK